MVQGAVGGDGGEVWEDAAVESEEEEEEEFTVRVSTHTHTQATKIGVRWGVV